MLSASTPTHPHHLSIPAMLWSMLDQDLRVLVYTTIAVQQFCQQNAATPVTLESQGHYTEIRTIYLRYNSKIVNTTLKTHSC